MTNVLVVDDSDVDQLLIAGLLKQNAGYEAFMAGNGVQALKKLKEWNFDIVITDLQMPEMDGLQLVKKMRENKVDIPVVLTTGVGSEEIAAEALRVGASGYIPKTKLNEMLIPTINDVLDILNSEKQYAQLLSRTKRCRYEIELENDPSLIPLIVDFCERRILSQSDLDRIDCLRIAMAIDQALKNALYRGNLELESDLNIQVFGNRISDKMPGYVRKRFESEPYVDRRIKVLLEIKESGFVIRITDDGPGFDTSHIGDLTKLATRGTNLMQAFMHEVDYNSKGNEVLMRYRFDGEPESDGLVSASGTLRDTLGTLTCKESGESHVINNQKYVIGKGTACHLKVQGENVSTMHCMLVSDNHQLVVVNLSGKYETLINGKPGSGKAVKDGDVLKLGQSEFRYAAP